MGGELKKKKKEKNTYGIAQHVQILKGMKHIGRRHRGQSANLLDADLRPAALVREHVDYGLSPVRTVTQQAQIAERLLRAAEPAFPFAQLVAEGDEQQAVAPTLVLR